MVYRVILPSWAAEEDTSKPRVQEGEFTDDHIKRLNEQFYNIYFLPNYPSIYDPSKPVDGSHIDTFRYVYVDMDLKEGIYESKEQFTQAILEAGLEPTLIVDSGNGVHVYWQVTDLDSLTFLRLQRRLIRNFKTDEAVAKIYQLMRMPGSINTKNPDDLKLCEVIYSSEASYISEQIDDFLPKITAADESYVQAHYNKTYSINRDQVTINDNIPQAFIKLLNSSKEVKEIWIGNVTDRSKSDFRLAHIMFASGLTKEEAASVLVNGSKALARAPVHRISYAMNIIDQIWTYELTAEKTTLKLSSSVKDILNKHGDTLKGTRFPCWPYLDNTAHGFRLGQVIGLVAGSGVGKTAMALNMFMGFVKNNPDYDHFFIPLEQPAAEIADRWKTMCKGDERLYDKVQILSNYDDNGGFRHLSFAEIKEYILQYQKDTNRKVGSIVVDHIGALKKKGKEGENQDLMTICHEMKAFAVETNTMLVMQSQAPREKAGIGDLELNKDAAYGTVYFESYCDYLITLWQPLKRCYNKEGCPTITAFKFCKIRHKKKELDVIQEDVPYILEFDSKTEEMKECSQIIEKAFDFWNVQSTNKRKADRKTDVTSYTSAKFEVSNGKTDNN